MLHCTDEETEAASEWGSRAWPIPCSSAIQATRGTFGWGTALYQALPARLCRLFMLLGVNRASLISLLFPFPGVIIHLVITALHLCLLALARRLCLP